MNVYKRNGRTGGTITDLDYIDGDLLEDKDCAFVLSDSDNIFGVYELDADSGATADGTTVIAPVTNAGTKRWIRKHYDVEIASFGVTGYHKFNNGIVIQWGAATASATPGAAVAVTFPIAYTTIYRVYTTGYTGNTNNAASWCDTATTTGCNIRAALASQVVNWMAIGFITPA